MFMLLGTPPFRARHPDFPWIGVSETRASLAPARKETRMERLRRIAWTGALALLCASALVDRAHAANCHEAVAGFGYGCETAGAGSSQVFDLDFDAAGATANGPGGRFQCFCSSTGVRVEGLKLEAGLGIVCVQSRGGDDGVVFSA